VYAFSGNFEILSAVAMVAEDANIIEESGVEFTGPYKGADHYFSVQ
jgi:hypothetical protein